MLCGCTATTAQITTSSTCPREQWQDDLTAACWEQCNADAFIALTNQQLDLKECHAEIW